MSLEEFFDNISDRGISVGKGVSFKELTRLTSDLGFCYFNKSDVNKALERLEYSKSNTETRLFLSWGAYSRGDIDTINIGNSIVDEAQACDVEIKWSGSVYEKMYITTSNITFLRKCLNV